jgi:hypothetical protein
MKENEFLNDAKRLIAMSAPAIDKNATYENVVSAMTFYSFGVERLLKHILVKVNPIFALKNGDFKHSAPCLYKDRFISTERNEQVAKEPDSDVVSFRVAMQRALLFSHAVQENKQLLYALANYRDILAHRPTSEIDLGKGSNLLARDAFGLVERICAEISEEINDFFDGHVDRLRKLRETIFAHEDLKKKMDKRLASHKKLWEHRRNHQDFLEQANDITRSLLNSSGVHFSYESFTCPACGQESVARIEPDYDYDPAEMTSYVTGVFVDNITCYFCNLRLEDYDEINYVVANSIFKAYADDFKNT